jgi:hypothetical protein
MVKKKNKNLWKGILIWIGCIIVFMIFAISWLVSVGNDSLEKEEYCFNECLMVDGAVDYAFDIVDDYCFCLDQNQDPLVTFQIAEAE